MNDSELLKSLPRVAAPSGFEGLVLDALRARMEDGHGRRRVRTFRWAMAGTAAGVLALFAGLNLFVLRGPDASLLSSLGPNGEAASGTISLNESVDYRHEILTASVEPGTVYILEQVSEASHTVFKY